MSETKIRSLFAGDIERNIEEIIKVDQTDEQIIRDELSEYVATDSIRSHFRAILERYAETPNKPHEGVGVWVSGFFGSGKSSFAKYLGLALENRPIIGDGAGDLLAARIGDPAISVLLKNISEHIPTHAVIFDVSTDRGIRSGSQTITEIMYRLFLRSLGYAGDLDLSELEITLEDPEAPRLDAFKAKFAEIYGREWDKEKGKVATAVQQASRVMHELQPEDFPTVDSWRESAMNRADINPGLLAERCVALMARRKPGHSLVFVIDEVGQFVARDVQKMLDLQAVVQSLGRVGRGTMWLVVTSQEKLSELVGGLDDTRVELARLMDRFPGPLQVHLEPSDISEVTSKRVLSKNAEAQTKLRDLFAENRGRLTDSTRLTADIRLPELTTEAFIDLYPLLPYQVDLIINVVSGLRTAGGASKHVGGANRTIIKLAQQLLIHPDVDLADQAVGTLARIDQVYQLVAGNVPSEIRGKIEEIGRQVDHPLAQPVAQAVCLLQYVQSIHCTAENIAATLQTTVGGDSRLSEVRPALDALERAQKVRLNDGLYKIPTPAEDDWERQRSGLTPKPGDTSRVHAEMVAGLWQPQPSHTFLNVKPFKAGLYLNGRQVDSGDIDIHLTLADAAEMDAAVEEARRRSQTEKSSIFWVATLTDAIDRESVEFFRSKEILSRKERGAQTKDETALVSEEKRRQRRHQEELRRLLRQALLAGSAFFRGNDRSPDASATEVGRAVSQVLAAALPEVFDRFEEAAASITKKDFDALLTAENLQGLTPVFPELHLVRSENGQTVLNAETGPLAEVLARIENRSGYGEMPSGRSLSDDFAKEPYGWEFDAVRLFVLALLRAGKIQVTSKNQVIESAVSLEAQTTFTNNNLFRSATFQPKKGLDFPQVVDASEFYKDTFGEKAGELEQGAVAREIRGQIERHETAVRDAHTTLVRDGLPGADILDSALDQMGAIRKSPEDQVILTFNASHSDLKEAIKRAAEIEQTVDETQLMVLQRAQAALSDLWPFLESEPDLSEADREHAAKLRDILERETFFRELPEIDQHTRALEDEFARRRAAAAQGRRGAYEVALATLKGTPGWEQLDQEQQDQVSSVLVSRSGADDAESAPIPLLREQTGACQPLLNKAVEEMLRIIDGNRVERLDVASYFAGGIETEEQLAAALEGLRERVAELIAAGKKVLIQ
jgi:hypothetical protein